MVRIGDFEVNIDKVSLPDLKKLRKYVPMEQYRLLKNRKCSRLLRRKMKKTDDL